MMQSTVHVYNRRTWKEKSTIGSAAERNRRRLQAVSAGKMGKCAPESGLLPGQPPLQGMSGRMPLAFFK